MTREEAIERLNIHKSTSVFVDSIAEAIDMAIEALSVANLKEEFESADATPTVIRAKTFMRKEDFDKWAEDIKKQNKSIVCIPCDAEVVSDDAVVRCKDCRHQRFYINDKESFHCDKSGIVNMHIDDGDGDFFCKYGERKE